MKKLHLAVVIPYTDSKLLILQDRHSISKYGEEWGFFGGSIEKGETPLEAAKREMQEELDWFVDELDVLGEIKDKYKLNGEDYSIHLHLFAKELKHGATFFSVQEGDGLALYDVEEARELKMAGKVDYACLDLFEKKVIN